MSKSAMRINLGLAVLPLVAAVSVALLISSPELLLITGGVLVVSIFGAAHVILSPVASFVAGIEAVSDPAHAPSQVVIAMPAEPVALFALAASDVGLAFQHATTDAGVRLHNVAAETGSVLSEAGAVMQQAAGDTAAALQDLSRRRAPGGGLAA